MTSYRDKELQGILSGQYISLLFAGSIYNKADSGQRVPVVMRAQMQSSPSALLRHEYMFIGSKGRRFRPAIIIGE